MSHKEVNCVCLFEFGLFGNLAVWQFGDVKLMFQWDHGAIKRVNRFGIFLSSLWRYSLLKMAQVFKLYKWFGFIESATNRSFFRSLKIISIFCTNQEKKRIHGRSFFSYKLSKDELIIISSEYFQISLKKNSLYWSMAQPTNCVCTGMSFHQARTTQLTER